MPLPNNFPGKELLEKDGYETVQEVSEATDQELLAIKGIAEGMLVKIREVAPHKPAESETGTGETSGKTFEPKTQSFQTQTSEISKDQIDPVTGQKLPEGIVRNERGTLTASSTVDQADMVHPDQVKKERAAMLRNAGAKIAALME